ncbi:MAG TPA: helix-turn-helix transcriptional regulator [Massilia sp.]|nr:helix-turn-helix transcriptional regulator [Massilia sp.]
MLLSERIKLAMKEAGLSQVDLARACGVKPPSVHGWLTGKAKYLRGENLLQAARALGVRQEWLATGSGPMRSTGDASNSATAPSMIRALHPEDPLPDDVISVPESRIEFSAGNGREPHFELEEDNEPATYRLSWFQKERINPERVKRFRVTGDSQEPFLFHRDTVLVNLDETEIVDGKLYAIRYGNDLRIKYLYRRLDGTLILRSKNPVYSDEEIPADLANEHISVIGRVRDKSGKGGL